ncbi:Ti-type conjugative transfer relaxase TraA [Legionella micdadei]|uniref:Ti-type conjugative transfer relaxase TraA n=1 Tax=Legionella micdadei TaxID=451 RepID=UPI0009EF74E9|nr:Ti-type conjugative transfer relaxase TraA [Legionella micdadei]ARG98618.1 Ti-type conjugative transfer relaxase TraA [Legionella micdadei]
MAIAFAHVSIHSRAKGHSALAASSYRAGVKLFDSRTGQSHDYSHRHDVIFSSVLLPEGTSTDFEHREFLWNQAELAEKRRDAQICKDIVLALPKELNLDQQIEITKRFAQLHFVNHGLPADIAIHDHGDGNPHAHILITTRRLEKNSFSRYKARDLNPTFANKFIVEKDYWGEQWRDFQNQFFIEHQLDLSVDLNHVISERHTGRLRDKPNSYILEENQLIKEARAELALFNPELFIQKIMRTHSVFTRRDIERLVFKTFEKTNNANDYLNFVAEILEHKNIIKLGANNRGIDSYTTRDHYIKEGKLLDDVEQLHFRKSHAFHNSLDKLINQYQLNEEQTEAMRFIAHGSDISVLIGRPGVGKSYLLKPLKEFYESNNCRVLGASLSGKVAKALQTDTGINSSTIASLMYRLSNEKLTLTKEHVLIIDEAGMVDFSSMTYLLEAVNKVGAKIILVGDPDQLKPIHQGEIFRGIASRADYIELENITRQRDLEDRKASLALAQGDIDAAIRHYSSKGAIHSLDDSEDATTKLVNEWQKELNPQSIKEHMMLAFTRATVDTLNGKAREAMQKQGMIRDKEFEYHSKNGTRKLMLAQGERILLRQNDSQLGVRNGDLATITHINSNEFSATLDSGEQITIPKSYRFIDYGYALTVHKAQGMTVNKASVFIDSPYWDRNLAFVAMTRHREKLNIYTNKHYHPDLESLTRTLSRSVTKDNVIDWPLDFALRVGFDSESLIGKAINYIAKSAHTIKDKWNYIVNYEAYINAQESKTQLAERENVRFTAQQIAGLLDEASDLRKQFKGMEKEAALKGLNQSELPQFAELYQRSIERDRQAAQMIQKESLEKVTPSPKVIQAIKTYAERYARYQAIDVIAEASLTKTLPEHIIKQAAKIDLKKDAIHISHLATKHNKCSQGLITQIKQIQQQHKQRTWEKLKETHPLLVQYEQLTQEHAKATGHKNQQLNHSLRTVAVAITGNKALMRSLKQELPKVAQKIQIRAQYQVQEHER